MWATVIEYMKWVFTYLKPTPGESESRRVDFVAVAEKWERLVDMQQKEIDRLNQRVSALSEYVARRERVIMEDMHQREAQFSTLYAEIQHAHEKCVTDNLAMHTRLSVCEKTVTDLKARLVARALRKKTTQKMPPEEEGV